MKILNIKCINDMYGILNRAILKLFRNDFFLLESGANERAVSHKLAGYLQDLLPEYEVDGEYNRHGSEPKRLKGIKEFRKSRNDLVIPDIVVHNRGDDSDNLMVIEIKTSDDDCSCDVKKLVLFTSQDGDYRYKYGFFIKFTGLNDPTIKRFENGAEV